MAGSEIVKTVDVDQRFPNTNQTKHCWTKYCEYYACIKAKGEDEPLCTQFKRAYASLCPDEWVEKWEEQRANGKFAGPQ
eukprot:CAMPEP_0184645132 /NCGR_PEP_ID=MMETSP0308-20130426/1675_1 /TAXON_ID=38269 /ORGANISM="Gloeochaete witrockiana, Strain SAG 46.84" /LENGTH=78 /DNA_ID=CAMNT_0027073967 /DNA_START=80 /DNA_END=316 /DNA_ORIENTATION=+